MLRENENVINLVQIKKKKKTIITYVHMLEQIQGLPLFNNKANIIIGDDNSLYFFLSKDKKE